MHARVRVPEGDASIGDLHARSLAAARRRRRCSCRSASCTPTTPPDRDCSRAGATRTPRLPDPLPGHATRARRAGCGRLLDVADRMLFLVLDRHGHAVGHLGFASAAAADRAMEIDNVVRGEAGRRG